MASTIIGTSLYDTPTDRPVFILTDDAEGSSSAMCGACIATYDPVEDMLAEVSGRDDSRHCYGCDYHADPDCGPGHWCTASEFEPDAKGWTTDAVCGAADGRTTGDVADPDGGHHITGPFIYVEESASIPRYAVCIDDLAAIRKATPDLYTFLSDNALIGTGHRCIDQVEVHDGLAMCWMCNTILQDVPVQGLVDRPVWPHEEWTGEPDDNAIPVHGFEGVEGGDFGPDGECVRCGRGRDATKGAFTALHTLATVPPDRCACGHRVADHYREGMYEGHCTDEGCSCEEVRWP